jgi:potassium/chloride transporter 4/5/6
MQKKLGTFLGVYTPTVLTILGVIMYLRFGWLVGHLGLGRILLIVLGANAITLVTTLSFSAVATNAPVGTGGAYYIISRSLGIEIGGAIGLPLFLSQAISVTLYAYGLSESLRVVWPDIPLPVATIGVIVGVSLLTYFGAEKALRTQVPLLALVGVSLVALAIGTFSKLDGGTLPLGEPSGQIGFWVGFAVFFPAVTGVMAGLGLSGDLKDASRAIPLGALLAVITGFFIYLAVPILLAAGASAEQLRSDSLVWTRIALLGPWLVFPGLWGAIFSSAVGSMLGAPRTLQALARDGLLPRFLWRKAGGKAGMLLPLLVSLAIAVAAVFLGNLNAVATVVTMFFLTVYGTINVVAAFEALSGDPSWRPRLRVPWPVNLGGGLACAGVMFLISPVAGAVAILAEIALWLFLSRREHRTGWGDARRGLYENLIRWALVKLSRRPLSARNWRPHVLAFVEDPVRELDLVRFANWFSQGRGVVTVCKLVIGDLLRSRPDLLELRQQMQEVLDEEKLIVFAEVDIARDLVEGIVSVAQANGMAGIASNTVLVGWPHEARLQVDFLRALRQLENLSKSLIIGRIQPQHLYRRQGVARTIHIWWGGMQRNGDLMLLLAHLLSRNPFWRGARVRVMSVATTELMKTNTEVQLKRIIPEIRIEVEPHVILKPKDVSVTELIHRESAEAEVVFLGLATPPDGEEAVYAERLEKLAGDLPTVFFVKNSSMFIGELLDVDKSTEEATLQVQADVPPSTLPGTGKPTAS